MPLTGSGSILGSALASAVGASGGPFGPLGDAFATWALSNVACLPGSLVTAAAAVSGFGTIKVVGATAELGTRLAAAVGAASAPLALKTWQDFAAAFCSHLETFGKVVPAFANPTPSGGVLTGTGTIAFGSMVFAPTLDVVLKVGGAPAPHAATAAALLAFGAGFLSHIAANAVVVPVSIIEPFLPYTGPPSGPVTGAGSIT